jgi:hypothetical protein
MYFPNAPSVVKTEKWVRSAYPYQNINGSKYNLNISPMIVWGWFCIWMIQCTLDSVSEYNFPILGASAIIVSQGPFRDIENLNSIHLLLCAAYETNHTVFGDASYIILLLYNNSMYYYPWSDIRTCNLNSAGKTRKTSPSEFTLSIHQPVVRAMWIGQPVSLEYQSCKMSKPSWQQPSPANQIDTSTLKLWLAITPWAITHKW